jgi:hypothetical protein
MNEHWESRPFGTRGYAALYTISYKMCSHAGQKDYSKTLYDRHKESIERYLIDVVAPSVMQKRDMFLLKVCSALVCVLVSMPIFKEFCDVWENHKIMTKWMWRLFMHLDRGIVINNNLPTLTSCSLQAFYTHVFQRIAFRVRLCMLECIEKDRRGEDVDGEPLGKCIQVQALFLNCVAESMDDVAAV